MILRKIILAIWWVRQLPNTIGQKYGLQPHFLVQMIRHLDFLNNVLILSLINKK